MRELRLGEPREGCRAVARCDVPNGKRLTSEEGKMQNVGFYDIDHDERILTGIRVR